jgi:hypothetical protein
VVVVVVYTYIYTICILKLIAIGKVAPHN